MYEYENDVIWVFTVALLPTAKHFLTGHIFISLFLCYYKPTILMYYCRSLYLTEMYYNKCVQL